MTEKDGFIPKAIPGDGKKEKKQIKDTLFNLFNISERGKEKTLFADTWLKKKAQKV